MKKIILIIAIAFCIFQMIVLAVDIDIGSPAITRPSYSTAGTVIDKNNPANATGKITSVEIFASTALFNVKVATFYVVSGNNLSTRDYESIPDVPGQGTRTFPVDLEVKEGDYLGIYYTSTGGVSVDTLGGGRWRNIATDNIPCTNTPFVFTDVRTSSLYGTGTTEVGWSHKWNTKTISKWNAKEIIKWNDLE